MNIDDALNELNNSKINKDYKVRLLGVRESKPYDPDNMYQDFIFLSIGDNCQEIFDACLDPGFIQFKRSMNSIPYIRLENGLWWLTPGIHLHSYECLVQDEPVNISRRNKHGVEISKDHGFFDINVISGGPEYIIGKWSQGCQLIKDEFAWGKVWNRFFRLVKNAMNLSGQDRVPYLLIEHERNI